jgi:hypothetical protein
MNVFHTKSCPICHNQLDIIYSHKFFREYHTCPNHYVHVIDIISGYSDFSMVHVPGFAIKYGILDTQIFTEEKHVFSIKGHFPIDFNNLQAASDRIKSLIVFS